ncbi:MAG: helix-turn-helix domain-containing protein [Nannocystales bacterium]
MKPTTHQLEFTSQELAEMLCEYEDAARIFSGWPVFERLADRLVGLHVRAELQLAEGDAAAARTIARIDVLMSVPFHQLAREADPPRRREMSQVCNSTAALGPMERLLVNATREGFRSEESFFRGVVRSEVARLGSHGGARTDVLSTAEAAIVARVTAKTIRAWVASGRLEPLGGRPYKFRRETVETARDRMPCERSVVDYDARAEEILGGKRRR